MKDIIITSNEIWGPIWFSKQHYANELSRMGYRVFFVNSPKKWQIRNLVHSDFVLKQEQESLWSVSYQNRLPVRVFPSLMLWLNDFMNSRLLERKLKLSDEVLWWQFDPFRFVRVSLKRTVKRIYHVTDEFKMHQTDLPIARRSDLIVGTSRPHYEYYLSYFPRKTIHIPHGVSAKQLALSEYEKDGSKILLVGTMNEDYDLALLSSLANENPERILEIIGPLNFESEEQKFKFKELRQMSNVNYVGPIPQGDLITYIKEAKVCISVYQFGLSRVLSSLKILNYLAAGKPVVTSVAQGFEELEGKGVFFAANQKDFISKVDQILEGSLKVNFEALDSFLTTRSYQRLIKTILANEQL